MKFILGKKLGMTQIFKDNGEAVAVTKVQAGPCQITQIKDNALQVGFGKTKSFRLNKPKSGHLKDLEPVRRLREFKVEKTDSFKKGDYVDLSAFVEGEKIAITGVSKGKGFAGVMKRYNFKCGPASHGQKHQNRMPGSIGATGPQKVFKGMKMGGRMGGDQVTVKNLEIIKIDFEDNALYVRGAVPGAKQGYLEIFAEGDLKIKQEKQEASEAKSRTDDLPAGKESSTGVKKEEEKVPASDEVVAEKPAEAKAEAVEESK